MNFIENSNFTDILVKYYYGGVADLSEKDIWPAENINRNHCKIYYIVDGKCTIIINGIKYEGKAGSLFLIPQNTRFTYYKTNADCLKKYWFHFSVHNIENNFFEKLNIPYSIDVGLSDKIENMFNDVLLYSKGTEIFDFINLSSSILNLLAFYISFCKRVLKIDIDNTNKKENDVYKSILDYIDIHLDEEIRISDLSKISYVNPGYFVRFFKHKFNITPGKYIKTQRMSKAMSLIVNTDMPITKIMFVVGYKNLNNFSRDFKQFYGAPPRNYRKTRFL